MRRTIAVLFLAGSLMQAQCRYYWFSKQQEKNIRIDGWVHCEYGKQTSYEQNPCFNPDPVVTIQGKQRKYTEVSNTPKPTGSFTDYKLVGVICQDKSGLTSSSSNH